MSKYRGRNVGKYGVEKNPYLDNFHVVKSQCKGISKKKKMQYSTTQAEFYRTNMYQLLVEYTANIVLCTTCQQILTNGI